MVHRIFKKKPNNAKINPKISVSNKLRLFLIDIDEIFPMQSSEFTKSLYF